VTAVRIVEIVVSVMVTVSAVRVLNRSSKRLLRLHKRIRKRKI
jgi:hypothetical protein